LVVAREDAMKKVLVGGAFVLAVYCWPLWVASAVAAVIGIVALLFFIFMLLAGREKGAGHHDGGGLC
jgi:uncharacterized membrane protein YqiK